MIIEEKTENNIIIFPTLLNKNYVMSTPVGIKIKEYENKVLIDFEQNLSWIALDPDNALILAEELKKYAIEIRSKTCN